MAQNRLRDYKEPLLSFDHNLINLGVHQPGRIAGFSDLVINSATSVSIGHTSTGVNYKDADGIAKGPMGVLMTPQGMIIMEDAPIGPFTVDNNPAAFARYDLIYCQHQYVKVQGGAAATYFITKGPNVANVKPLPTDPKLQTIIGWIKVPAGATDLTGAKWIKFKSPDSGDGEDARLDLVNYFSRTQMWGALNSTDYTLNPSGEGFPVPSTNDFIRFKPNGNCMTFQPITQVKMGIVKTEDWDLTPGVEFTFLINSNVRIIERALSTLELQNGAKAFIIPLENAKFTQETTLIKELDIPTGKSVIVKMVLLKDNKFYISSFKPIDFKPTSDGFKPGMLIDVDMDADEMAQSFDSSGLGVGDYEGYCIPNGNPYPLPNGGFRQTKDYRGRMRFTHSGVPADGANPLDPSFSIISALNGGQYGVTKIVLGSTNIPRHRFFTAISNTGDNEGVLTSANAINVSKDNGQQNGYILSGGADGVQPNVGVTNWYGGNPDGSTNPVTILPPCIATITVMKLY